jgi:hypothetical protein
MPFCRVYKRMMGLEPTTFCRQSSRGFLAFARKLAWLSRLNATFARLPIPEKQALLRAVDFGLGTSARKDDAEKARSTRSNPNRSVEVSGSGTFARV